jgi:hypothetical protein
VGRIGHDEAKRFLIERIAARASAEGLRLSESEQRLLAFSEGESGEPPEPLSDASDEEEFEHRMAGLLRRAYEADNPSPRCDSNLYDDAFATLTAGDHYLGWIVQVAGFRPPAPRWLQPFKQLALGGLLVIPGLLALMMAGGALWAALGPGPPEEKREMVGVAIMFAAFGAFLFALWFREWRR